MREYIIIDDTGVVLKDLPEDEVMTAYALFTAPERLEKTFSDMPEALAKIKEKFSKPVAGKIILARIVKTFPE